MNQCIYCKRSDKPLSKEHIVPLSLGGNLILPKSSCASCGNVIHSYESKTLQTTLGTVRRRLNFPSRHKKYQTSHVEIGVVKADGSKERLNVPRNEYPVGVALPGYNRANIFYGVSSDVDTLGHIAQNFYLNGDLNAFKEKYSWDGILELLWLPVEFGQTIIKICYAYATVELGLNAFQPICLDHILKKNMNISHIFGQNGVNEAKDGEQKVWDLSLGLFVSQANGILLVAYCSIFPGGGTPVYEVVLGRISDAAHIETWNDMLLTKRWSIAPPITLPDRPPSVSGSS